MLFEGEHRKTNIKLFSGVSLVRGDSGGTHAAAARVRSSRASQPCRRLSTRPEARTGARISVARPLCFLTRSLPKRRRRPQSGVLWPDMWRGVVWVGIHFELVRWYTGNNSGGISTHACGAAAMLWCTPNFEGFAKNIGWHVYIHVLLLEPPLFFVMRSICHQPILFDGYLCFYVSLLV